MSIQKELPWVAEARKHIGLKEISGSRHNPTIIEWLKEIPKYSKAVKPWWADDEMAWCGTFVAAVMGRSGRYVVPNWFRAKEWGDSTTMTRLSKPAYGAIVTFGRQGGGHVGIVVGIDTRGRILVLGGNQSNAVNIMAFDPSRVLGYWWPSIWDANAKKPVKSVPSEIRYKLPKYDAGTMKLSTNEA